MSTPFDVVNDNFTRGIIRRKAKQIIKRPGFSGQDFEALEQSMLAQVIKAMRSFDPQISHPNVFITTVVERFVRTLLRQRVAEKREPSHLQSLNVPVRVPDDHPTQLQYTLEECVGEAHLQVSRRSTEHLSNLISDVATVISTLPEPMQRMLELRKSHSMCQIEQLMAVPRTTLRKWMEQVAEKFEKAGLREYLA